MERDPKILGEEIQELKKEHNAVILAHNYQLGEIQEMADHVGDSLALAKIADEVDEQVIVFCGVHFMAETAHILAPNKTVLLPEKSAGCALAQKGDPQWLRDLKDKKPDLVVVCYVNSTAEIKALSDICCTSANAEAVVKSIPANREILFVPDQYLGGYISRRLNRPMLLASGYCPTHARMTIEDVRRKKKEYPNAKLMVHPESRKEVVDEADVVTGTGGMLRYVKSPESEGVKTFLVGTEIGLLKRLERENPDKMFVAVSEDAVCPDMKLITLESVIDSLKKNQYIVTLPDDLRERAHKAVVRMIEIGK